MKRKLAALFLALTLTLGLAAPALAAETATLIRLTKTTGTVEISKSSGKSVPLLKNMRLYNGYHVVTGEEGYAWINLDDSKLNKQDAESEVEVRKDGKKLEVLLCSGNLFFDVAEPLENDESMNIRTSTTAVGIRGTSGWVECVDRWTTRVSVLEGTVECSVADPVTGQIKAEEVRGGETVLCVVYPQEKTGDKSAILRDKFAVDDIPGFVLTELTRDMALCDKIEAATGLDIPRDLAAVAGGDPSGREPDREHATKEVLDESDRREDEDEEALHEKLEEIEKELEKQPDNISPDKPIEKPAPSAPPDSGSGRDDDSGSGGGSGGGTTTPDPTPTPPQTHGMKLTDVEVQALLADTNNLSIEPNTDAADATPKKNTLEVDTGLSVASGKTLDLQSGIDLEVCPGKALRVDGTLTADALTNNGTTTVTSGNTLHLRGNLTTAGTMNVTDTGRVVVDGTFTRSGTLTLADGAAVLAKSFASGAAPEGWEVSAEADASGYYRLTPEGGDTPVDPETSSITFDANGGKWGTDTRQTIVQTNTDGTVTWPEEPTCGDTSYGKGHYGGILKFKGWRDESGAPVQANQTFQSETVLTAYWDGWYLDPEGTLVVGGEGSLEAYYTNSFWSSPDQVYLKPPAWYQDAGTIKEAVFLEGVTEIGSLGEIDGEVLVNALGGCGSLTSVTIPGNVTSIGDSAFSSCSSLTSVTIPEGVTSIEDYAFYGCSSLTSMTIPGNVTSIGDSAFSGCSGLTSVTIPDGVTSMGRGTFYGCSSLTSVTIPEGVTSIGDYAFQGCSSLNGMTIPDSVTSIGSSAFSQCTSLTGVTIPGSVTSIGPSAFSGCSNLTAITVSEENPAYSSDDIALFNKDKTTLLKFPEGHNGPYNIPSSVTSIERAAFYGCSSLTDVTIPGNVTSIGSAAFYGCSSLTSVTIPEGITIIEGSTFANCSRLRNVTIPASITNIEYYAFQNCLLSNIYFGGTQEQWNNIRRLNNLELDKATMHYASSATP